MTRGEALFGTSKFVEHLGPRLHTRGADGQAGFGGLGRQRR